MDALASKIASFPRSIQSIPCPGAQLVALFVLVACLGLEPSPASTTVLAYGGVSLALSHAISRWSFTAVVYGEWILAWFLTRPGGVKAPLLGFALPLAAVLLWTREGQPASQLKHIMAISNVILLLGPKVGAGTHTRQTTTDRSWELMATSPSVTAGCVCVF